MKHILPNKKLGFGKYFDRTGSELARSAEGSQYLYWAYQQPGIEVAPELVGLQKRRLEPIVVSNQLIADAKANHTYHSLRGGCDL